MGQLFSQPRTAHEIRRGKQRSKSHTERPASKAQVLTTRSARNGAKPLIHDRRRGSALLNDEPERARTNVRAYPSKRRTHETRSNLKNKTSSNVESHRSRAAHPRVSGSDHRQRNKAAASQSYISQPRSRQGGSNQHHSTTHTNTRHLQPKDRKECVVCADDRPLHRFPNHPPTTRCTHEVNVCRQCLRTWIASEFASKIWDEIDCPICSLRLQHEDMQEFAPSQIFRRYDKLSTRAALEAIPGFTWCIAKNCKSGHVSNMNTTKFRCIDCRKTHCTYHGVAWHTGETCDEYDYRTNKTLKKVEEIASKRLISETTKKCPGCKRSIEKNNGCDHMTCTRCKHEFCWQCLAPYTSKNQMRRVVHVVGCQYYDPD